MPFVDVGDIRVYYEIHGSGPRLLIISGTGGDLRNKPNMFDWPLASHFEILGYDQRGLGQTDKPDTPYTMADYAGDAAGLLEALGWDSCPVMGVSFGGMVAQEMALTYPERLERLVLACTSSGGRGGASYPIHEFDGLPPRERALRVIPILDTRNDAAWQAAHPREFHQMVEQTAARFQRGADEPDRKAGALRQLRARTGHDTYDRLPNLDLPVFICGGRYDGIAPVSNLEALHRQIPGAHLELFEGGHLFLTQDPAAFGRIQAFLLGKLDS